MTIIELIASYWKHSIFGLAFLVGLGCMVFCLLFHPRPLKSVFGSASVMIASAAAIVSMFLAYPSFWLGLVIGALLFVGLHFLFAGPLGIGRDDSNW